MRIKAEELRRTAERLAAEADRVDGCGLTIAHALDRYKDYMRHDKGNKPSSVEATSTRIRRFLGDADTFLSSITADVAAARYAERRREVAVDTHRNELGQVKTFIRWCIEQGWIWRDPFARVKPIGKRRRGKKQLRIAETRRVVAIALTDARRSDDACDHRQRFHRLSSLAVLVALYLGMRAGEVVNIRRRDIDDGGRLLWIPDAKTENGRRTLEVADVLRPLLLARALECGDNPEARLFPRSRGWVRDNVKRLCRAAGVPEVTAHGARGIHATIAARMGTTSHAVAMALGQGGDQVAKRHYIQPGTLEQAKRDEFARTIGHVAQTGEESSPAAGRVVFRLPDHEMPEAWREHQ